jgi:hypothetical protein
MKNIFYNYSIFILGAILFSNCNSSQSSEAPEIQAAEKEIIESFVNEETETAGSLGTAADSLISKRKIILANSANSSPFKEKSCDDILVWLDDAVRKYIASGDTIILNSFINIESDVIFMSCLKSENQNFRKQYDKTLELLE